ncbi:MAG: phage major capsid protein [Oxalobacteraceae bacterium]|nr:MAG: phage major capsid protein [Oxalobacteraceae bacterium]
MPIRKVKNERLIRALRVDDAVVEEASRKIKFSFSSEEPVERWFGLEVLSHAPEAVDLSRMNGGANALFNHNVDDYVGVVESAYIGDDKRGYCEVRFGEGEQASEVMRDVRGGILRNVSFGYQINDLILSRQGEGGADSEYTATSWQPFEVSFVTIPADPTVGVGRSAETCENERLKELVAKADHRALEQNAPVPVVEPTPVEPTPVEPAPIQIEVIENKPAAPSANEESRKMELNREEVLKAERERMKLIEALCDRHDMKDESRSLINEGKTIEEARALVLEKLASRHQHPVGTVSGEIGLSKKEKRDYSFMNVIRAQMFPNDKGYQEAAAMEKEASDAVRKLTGKQSRGYIVPLDVLLDKRAGEAPQQVAQAPLGGNLVSHVLQPQSFIDLLRNRSALVNSGVQTLTGLSGGIDMPRKIQASTAWWVGEGQDVPLSDMLFDQVSMSPKTVGDYVEYTRRLMLQSSLDIEAMIRSDIAETIALEIDRAALYGTGSGNMPRGLKNQTGISIVPNGGATPTWAQIVAMESAITASNADIGTMKYLFGAALGGTLKTVPKGNAGFPIYLLGDDGRLNGYEKTTTNQVAPNDIFFGVWSNMIMGFFSGLDILVDPYSKATSGNVRVVAMQDCDIAIRQPKAFAMSTYSA